MLRYLLRGEQGVSAESYVETRSAAFRKLFNDAASKKQSVHAGWLHFTNSHTLSLSACVCVCACVRVCVCACVRACVRVLCICRA
jgi:hypothetical protein